MLHLSLTSVDVEATVLAVGIVSPLPHRQQNKYWHQGGVADLGFELVETLIKQRLFALTKS